MKNGRNGITAADEGTSHNRSSLLINIPPPLLRHKVKFCCMIYYYVTCNPRVKKANSVVVVAKISPKMEQRGSKMQSCHILKLFRSFFLSIGKINEAEGAASVLFLSPPADYNVKLIG